MPTPKIMMYQLAGWFKHFTPPAKKFQLVYVKELENSGIWEAKFAILNTWTFLPKEQSTNKLLKNAVSGRMTLTYNQYPEHLKLGEFYSI